MRLFSTSLWVACIFLSAGCGFRLAGIGLKTPVAVSYEQGYQVTAPELIVHLRQSLQSEQAQSVGNAPRLKILSIGQSNELLSVDSAGKGIEYELIIDVDWEFIALGQAAVRHAMRARRSYGFVSGQALAEAAEKKLLVDELHAELAQRITLWVERQMRSDSVSS